jgi:predicted metalloprotease with PDZ domain
MCIRGTENTVAPQTWPRQTISSPCKTICSGSTKALTNYLGEVLTARSGLLTAPQLRDDLAITAAMLDHTPGREWRNLQDTADAAPQLYFSPRAWHSWRRSTDFYDEDTLNWLWADVIIRQQSKGAKTLDDFCKLFHGAPSTGPMVKPYTFDDVVNT